VAQPLRVLVVEDDAVDRKFLVRSLRRAESEVAIEQAADLAGAREKLTSHRFDCILTDLRLPDGEGTELIEETPAAVVVITGGDGRDARDALAAGAQDWLDKGQVTSHSVGRAVTYACMRARHGAIERRVKRAERFAAVGQVAAILSHELNNAGAVVVGVLELLQLRLQDEPGFEDDAEMLQNALDAAERTARITRGLMGYSKLRVTQDRDVFTIDELADSLQHLFGQRSGGVRLELSLGEVPPLRGAGGPLLDTLVVMTMTLAERIEQQEGVVSLAIAWQEGLRVRVSCAGRPFPPEVRAQALDAFLHVHGADSDAAFGLWLADDVTSSLGGTLRFGRDEEPALELWLPLERAGAP